MKARDLEEFGSLLDGGLEQDERVTVRSTRLRLYDEEEERYDIRQFNGPIEIKRAGTYDDHRYTMQMGEGESAVSRGITPEEVTVTDRGTERGPSKRKQLVTVHLDEEKRLILENLEGIYY